MNESESSSAPTNSSLLEDTPLDNPEKDLLGRSNFSRALAQAILNIDAEYGFVFGLFGPWGSGKTTTLNFVLHYIKELSSEDDRPIIVRFNPWWFSGQEQLLLQFFGQMRAVLGKQDVPKGLQNVGYKLQLFAKALAPMAYVPGVKDLAKPIQELIDHSGATIEEVGKQAEANVIGIREEIDKALRGQPRKILVVIDDIDRLTAEEIRLMFRLIKAVADFPRTVYLLAFDRDVVVGALEELQAGSGEGYLEKIVQAPFDLPSPDRSAMRRLLFTQLELLLQGTPDELWDQTEWANVYFDAIDYFIYNPRDIKRLVNTLRASYSVVRGEVNFVDFVAIETLRVFVPGMYGVIRANPTLFAGTSYLGDSTTRDNLRKTLEQYLDSATSSDTRQPTHVLLLRLFPRYANAFGGSLYGSEWEQKWRRHSKICSPAVFPVYFRLAFEEGAVTAAEMRSLIALGHDSQALAAELVRLSKERGPGGDVSRAREVLERVEDYARDGIPQENIPSVLQALYDAGDALLEAGDRSGMMDFENDLRIWSITDRLLLRIPEQQSRFEIFKDVVSRSKSILMLAHLLVSLGDEHGKYGGSAQDPEAKRAASSDQLRDLEMLLLQRIEGAAQNGELAHIPDLHYVLALWGELSGSEEPPRDFVSQMIEPDAGLVSFLGDFLGQIFSTKVTDRVEQSQWIINILQLQKWIDTDVLRDRAISLLKDPPDWLTEKQKLALEVFLDNLERAPKGFDAFGRPIKE